MANKKVTGVTNQVSKFEATMLACQKAKTEKKSVSKKPTASAIKENKKTAIKNRNRQTERMIRGAHKFEDMEDPEETDLPDDTATDAVVVIDPDMSTDDYEAGLDDLQAIIDETPDGETPSTDEYVGDMVYTCPICGNNFFSDAEMTDGPCPVCGEEVDEFILVGGVESPDEALGSDEEGLDDYSDSDTGDEDLSDIEDIPEDDEAIEEELEAGCEDDDCSTSESRSMRRRKAESKATSLKVNEDTFNPFLTKFIKENYKNASSMKVVGAKLAGRTLRLECKITFKSGKVSNTVVSLENFKKSTSPVKICASADKTFKVESKRGTKVAPFTFECKTSKTGVITCSGLKYSFITKKEGKTLQIYGNYALKESARNFPKGTRK